jgi:hypothetical protein
VAPDRVPRRRVSPVLQAQCTTGPDSIRAMLLHGAQGRVRLPLCTRPFPKSIGDPTSLRGWIVASVRLTFL